MEGQATGASAAAAAAVGTGKGGKGGDNGRGNHAPSSVDEGAREWGWEEENEEEMYGLTSCVGDGTADLRWPIRHPIPPHPTPPHANMTITHYFTTDSILNSTHCI